MLYLCQHKNKGKNVSTKKKDFQHKIHLVLDQYNEYLCEM